MKCYQLTVVRTDAENRVYLFDPGVENQEDFVRRVLAENAGMIRHLSWEN